MRNTAVSRTSRKPTRLISSGSTPRALGSVFGEAVARLDDPKQLAHQAGALEPVIRHMKLAARCERGAHRGETGLLLLERHLVEHEARDDLVHAAAAQQIGRVARVAAREPDDDARRARLAARAREHVGVGVDADQRRAARAAADQHELRAGAAAHVGDHVARARRDLGEQRAAASVRARASTTTSAS